jgi:hypothetical protein
MTSKKMKKMEDDQKKWKKREDDLKKKKTEKKGDEPINQNRPNWL